MGAHYETQKKSLKFVCGVKKAYGEKHRKEDKVLHLDNSSEYTSDPFLQLCHDEGIERHFTVREIPQQNGVADRTCILHLLLLYSYIYLAIISAIYLS